MGFGDGGVFFGKIHRKQPPWAHLDIAGMAWAQKATPTVPLGGTGYGVRMLTRFIADFDTARL